MPRQKKYLAVSTRSEPLRALESMLSKDGAAEFRAFAGKKAWAEIEASAPTAVFLDADDASGENLPFCLRLRKILHPTSCAVIFFGHKIQGPQTIRFLDQGADDYWNYPFNEGVCLAYLRAMERRLSPMSAGETLGTQGLRLDPARREASIQGRPLRLRAKEFDLLYFFLRQPGKALGRDALMTHVWGQEYFGTTRTVDFHIVQLRQKLGPLGHWIETVPGIGYRLKVKGPIRR